MRVRAQVLELLLQSNLTQENFAVLLGLSCPTVAHDLDPRTPMSERIGLYSWVVAQLTEKQRWLIRPGHHSGMKIKSGVPPVISERILGLRPATALEYAQYRAGMEVLRYGKDPTKRINERIRDRLALFALQGSLGKKIAQAQVNSPWLAATSTVTRMAAKRVTAIGPDLVREALGRYLRRLRGFAPRVFARTLDGLQPGYVGFDDLGGRNSHRQPEYIARRRAVERKCLDDVLAHYDGIRQAAKNLVRERRRMNGPLSRSETALLHLATFGSLPPV